LSTLTFERLSSEYVDVLKEIGNIGAGNATTALAQLLDTKVDMSVPNVQMFDFSEISDYMGGADRIMGGIYLGVEGDISGSIMFILGAPQAKFLVNKLTGGMGDPKGDEFNEMELSALKEVGNIISGAYLNALSMMTGLKMIPTVPCLAIDMAGAILSVPAIEFGMMGDKIMLIDNKFFETDDEVDLNGYFLLLPDMESYEKILTSLGIDYGAG